MTFPPDHNDAVRASRVLAYVVGSMLFAAMAAAAWFLLP